MYQGWDHLFILRLEHAVHDRIREGCLRILDVATIKKKKSVPLEIVAVSRTAQSVHVISLACTSAPKLSE